MLIKIKTHAGKSKTYAIMDKSQDDGLSNIVQTTLPYPKPHRFSSGIGMKLV
jgi:hypothetical protein